MVLQNAAYERAELPAGSRLGCRAVESLDIKEFGHLVQARSKLPDPGPRVRIVLPKAARPALSGEQCPHRNPSPPSLFELIGSHRCVPVASLVGRGNPTASKGHDEQEHVAAPDLAQAFLQGGPVDVPKCSIITGCQRCSRITSPTTLRCCCRSMEVDETKTRSIFETFTEMSRALD
jgi:hypothetical protein